jgi:hypothetical protein
MQNLKELLGRLYLIIIPVNDYMNATDHRFILGRPDDYISQST